METGTVYPDVAVIIPTLNAEPWLGDLLGMLARQTLQPVEVLIIDSSSTDKTLDIARVHGARIISIRREEFDHGGTRTMAAGLVSADVLVYMTQDAVPADCHALARLVAPLGEEKTAASYGRQLPRRDATLFSAHLRLFNYPPSSRLSCYEDRVRLGFRTIFISNSFAAYQRSVLLENGCFSSRLLFGEDTLAVAKLLENGYCVAYVSEACVFHSHNYSILQDIRRYFDIGVFHADQSGHLKAFGGPGNAGRKYVHSELAMIVRKKKYFLFPEFLLRNLGKYLAYQLGKKYHLLPQPLARKLSMNPGWWS